MGRKSKKKVQWRRLSLNDSTVQPCQEDFNCNSDFYEVSRSPTPHCNQEFSKDCSEQLNPNSKRHFYPNDRRYCNTYDPRGSERSGSVERDFSNRDRYPNTRSCSQDHHRPYRDGVLSAERRKQFRHFPRQSYFNGSSPHGGVKRRWSEEDHHYVEYFRDGANFEGVEESSDTPLQPVHTVLIGNEEYTKIQTPRQEVMFRKNFFDRKRDTEDNFSVTSTTGGDLGSLSDSVDDSLSTSEDLNPGHTETAVFDDNNYMFAGEPGRPPLAGVVMQQVYPGGPMISIPVHWTPFIDPNLIPGDTALTTLDPSFTHIIDHKSLPPDSAHILPVQHDADGCPVTVQVKLDANGVPVEIEPSTFTVSLSSLNQRQQETILQQAVYPISNMISQVPNITGVPESLFEEFPIDDAKDNDKNILQKDTAPISNEPTDDTEKRESKDSEDSSSDSQYASMSEASTTPTTPSGELSFPNESSQVASLEAEPRQDKDSQGLPDSKEPTNEGDNEASREITLSRGDSLISSETSEMEVEGSAQNIFICSQTLIVENIPSEKESSENSETILLSPVSDLSPESFGEQTIPCTMEEQVLKEETPNDQSNNSLENSLIDRDSKDHPDPMDSSQDYLDHIDGSKDNLDTIDGAEDNINNKDNSKDHLDLMDSAEDHLDLMNDAKDHLNPIDELSDKNTDDSSSAETCELTDGDTSLEEPSENAVEYYSPPEEESTCPQNKVKKSKKSRKSNSSPPDVPSVKPKETLDSVCEPALDDEDDNVFVSSNSDEASESIITNKSHRHQKKNKKDRSKQQEENGSETRPTEVEEESSTSSQTKDVVNEREPTPSESTGQNDEEISPENANELKAPEEETQSKPGYVIVPILTPYYDPAVLYGYPLVMQDQQQPSEKPYIKNKRKKFKKYSEARHSAVFLDTELYTGEPYMATPNGYLVPVESQQLCQIHGYQFPFSPMGHENSFVSFDHYPYMNEEMQYRGQISPRKNHYRVPSSFNKKSIPATKTYSNDLSDSGVSESEENLLSNEKNSSDLSETAPNVVVLTQDKMNPSTLQDSLPNICENSAQKIPDDSNENQPESPQVAEHSNSDESSNLPLEVLEKEREEQTLCAQNRLDKLQCSQAKSEEDKSIPSSNSENLITSKIGTTPKSKEVRAKPTTKTPKNEKSRKRNKASGKGKNKVAEKQSTPKENEVLVPSHVQIPETISILALEPEQSALQADTNNPTSRLSIDLQEPANVSKNIESKLELQSPIDNQKLNSDTMKVMKITNDQSTMVHEQFNDMTQDDKNTCAAIEQPKSKDATEKIKTNSSIQSSIEREKLPVGTPEKLKNKTHNQVSICQPEQNSDLAEKVKISKPKVSAQAESESQPTETLNKTPNGRKSKNTPNKKNKTLPNSSNDILFTQISDDDILSNDIQKIQDHILPLLAKESIFIPKSSHSFSMAMQQFSPFMYNEDSTYKQISNNRIYISPHLEKDRPLSKKESKRKFNRFNNSITNFDLLDFEESELPTITTSPVGFGSINLDLLESRVSVPRKGSREEVGISDSTAQAHGGHKESNKDLKPSKKPSKSKSKKNIKKEYSDKEAEKPTISKTQEPNKSSAKKRTKKAPQSPSPNTVIVKSEKHAKKQSCAKSDLSSEQICQKPPNKSTAAQDSSIEENLVNLIASCEEKVKIIETLELETESSPIFEDYCIHSECLSNKEKSDSHLDTSSDQLNQISIYKEDINSPKDQGHSMSVVRSVDEFEGNKAEDRMDTSMSHIEYADESASSNGSLNLRQELSSDMHSSMQLSINIIDVPTELTISSEVLLFYDDKKQVALQKIENVLEAKNESTKVIKIEGKANEMGSAHEPILTEANSCSRTLEEGNNALQNLGVTEAVKRWIREVTPEKAFVMPEVSQGRLLSPVESEDEFIDDDLKMDEKEMFQQMPKNVIGNPTAALPSEEGLGSCSIRVANKFQGFVLDSIDDADKTSIVSSIVSRGQLYSESSFSLPVSAELSFDDDYDDSHRDLSKYDPSIYSKYYQLGVGVDSPTPVPSSRASSKDRDSSILFGSEDLEVEKLNFIEQHITQDPSSYTMSLATELFKAEKIKANMTHISETEAREDLPMPTCGAVSNGTLTSPLSSGIGSSLASSPTNTPSHRPLSEDKPKLSSSPLKNTPLPCKTVCCSLM